MEDVLKQVVILVCSMNDPKYINSLQHIGQICREKSDVLVNIQAIQNQLTSAHNEINKCNNRLKELVEE